jgi:hypothetical protein
VRVNSRGKWFIDETHASDEGKWLLMNRDMPFPRSPFSERPPHEYPEAWAVFYNGRIATVTALWMNSHEATEEMLEPMYP